MARRPCLLLIRCPSASGRRASGDDRHRSSPATRSSRPAASTATVVRDRDDDAGPRDRSRRRGRVSKRAIACRDSARARSSDAEEDEDGAESRTSPLTGRANRCRRRDDAAPNLPPVFTSAPLHLPLLAADRPRSSARCWRRSRRSSAPTLGLDLQGGLEVILQAEARGAGSRSPRRISTARSRSSASASTSSACPRPRSAEAGHRPDLGPAPGVHDPEQARRDHRPDRPARASTTSIPALTGGRSTRRRGRHSFESRFDLLSNARRGLGRATKKNAGPYYLFHAATRSCSPGRCRPRRTLPTEAARRRAEAGELPKGLRILARPAGHRSHHLRRLRRPCAPASGAHRRLPYLPVQVTTRTPRTERPLPADDRRRPRAHGRARTSTHRPASRS